MKSTEPNAPPGIPDHELLRCIGRGSYGDVWLARNVMGTLRAVKIVRRNSFSDQRPFDREYAGIERFEPLSRSHEGLIDILQVGRNDAEGYFYYVMELADDQLTGATIEPETYRPRTLARPAGRERLPFDQCLRVSLLLADALEHLHANKLVHRDIKPSNIIFVNGIPKLADIGLVTGIDEVHSYVGTEGFIPPEGQGTPAADIYSLGKVLYEISTGKDRLDFPELPTDLAEVEGGDLFLELNEIIVRACQSNPARRYAAAQELRGDLTVLAFGKSVRRLRMLERRMVRLTRIAAGAAAVLIAGSLVFSQVDRERRRSAEQHQRQVGALVANGTRALDAGDLLGGLPSLVRALRLDAGTERDRTHRLRIHSLLASSPKLTQFWQVQGGITNATLNDTGDALAATHFDGTVSLWRLSDSRPPERIANATGHNVALHSGAKRLALVNGNEIQIWQLDPPQAIFVLRHSNIVNSVRFNGDGSQFIAAYDDHTARIWTTATGAAGQVFQGHTAGVTHACFSADGRLVATSSRDGTARIWHAADARPTVPPLWHGSWVYHVAFSPDGEFVATADYEHQAHIWNAATGRRTVSPLQHGDVVRTVRFSPDNRYLLTGSWDSTARLWLVETGYPVALNPVLHHTHRVMYAAFTRNGRQIATACQDGTVRVWDLAGAMEARSRIVDRFSRTGDRAFVISNDMVQVFDRLTQHAAGKPFCLGEAPKSAFLSDDGAYLTTFHDAGPSRSVPEAQVWAVASGRPWGAPVRPLRHSDYAVISDRGEYLATLISNVVTIHSLHDRNRAPIILSETNTRHFAWSPDARRLATVGSDCICVWDPATGRPAAPDMPHPKADKVVFSKSGETLASWALDSGLSECYAQVWHTATGERRGAPLRHRDGIQDLAFSPDGKRLITASEDHTAVIWDLATSAPAVPPLKHRKQVAAVGFSRHGRWVFTAGRDGTARIWDTQTGEPITPWLNHPPPLWDGRFLRNDEELFVIGDFRQGWLWNLQLELRSAGDLTRLSQLLAAEGEVNPRETELIWQQMRAAYPDDFVASRAEITAWHEQESLSAEREEKWPQALFHLDQLRQLEPENFHWRDRHKAVRARQR